MSIRVAVDAMGGDEAPSVVVEGAVRALRAAENSLEVLLFGPEATLRAELAAHDTEGLPLRVLDAPDVIGMAEAPTSAVKRKPNSSIHRGIGAVKAGEADAFASAGNTGAVMAASLFILGRVPGVLRPSVLGLFPTTHGSCVVLDVGTNVDCKPEHLLQFAWMGRVYAQRILHRDDPAVALMNIGEEPGKGNELVKASYELLNEAVGLNFQGNIEGRDLLHHGADVVVCDGFVGNVMLKLGESVVTALTPMCQTVMQEHALDEEQRGIVSGTLRSVQRRFDYQEYGGAPLLGVNGPVLIGHGSSSPRAIERMIQAAAELAAQDVTGSIAAVLAD